MANGGYLAMVLHAHLPFVRHPEQVAFLEEDWLHHAITECYVPLLDAFQRLSRDGIPFRVTLSFSPTLCEMLRDDLLRTRFLSRLGRLSDVAAHLDAELSTHYVRRMVRARQVMEASNGDLLSGYARLEEQGHLEITGVGATHAVLPLVKTPQARRAQIRIGVESHQRHFGRRPRGMWLPECAWIDGLDAPLVEHGIRHVVLEAGALVAALPTPARGLAAPVATNGGLAAFGRDPEASRRVWSAEEGYPGDPVYREFHRDFGWDADAALVRPLLSDDGLRRPVGLKCHRVTGPVPLHEKERYQPRVAARRAQEHAGEFLSGCIAFARQVAERLDRPPLIVAPFDAELFGHWWYEGPVFLEALFRAAARMPGEIRFVTLGEYLDLHGPGDVVDPAPSTWGQGSDLRTWLHEGTAWMLREAHDAEDRMVRLSAIDHLSAALARARRQAGRELLLAQASDWAFLITAGTSKSYAERRFGEHIANLTALADGIESGRVDEGQLEQLQARHNLFPWLDPLAWKG